MAAPKILKVQNETFVSLDSIRSLAENMRRKKRQPDDVPKYLESMCKNIAAKGEPFVLKSKRIDDDLLDRIEKVIVCVRENITPCSMLLGRCEVHGETAPCTIGEIVEAAGDLCVEIGGIRS
jgi:hypothetical protein